MKATHGSTPTRLANGSQATAKMAESLKRARCLDAKLFFSTYSNNPEPVLEEKLTKEILPTATWVGAIPTTSAEAIALKEHCDEIGLKPQSMVIVTDEFNSRRTRDIYQLFFPTTEIYIVAIPVEKTWDPESPIENFRNLNRAILWETLVPLVPFWVMTHTGTLGKNLLAWLSERVCQTAAT